MKRFCLVPVVTALASAAYADPAGYSGRHEVTTSNDTLSVRHVHDWDSEKLRPLFFDLQHHDKFFTSANDFALVEVCDSSRNLVFSSPAPAFTYLWISPDSQFVIGLSDIKLWNPYQLVVWRRDGRLIHREHISNEVAKLSPEQKREFAQRFPQADQLIGPRCFIHGDATYIDFDILGVPDGIGDDAWRYLSALRVQHPYSGDFRESITNTIFWFDREHPQLSLVRGGPESEMQLSLRSPRGNRFTIVFQTDGVDLRL